MLSKNFKNGLCATLLFAHVLEVDITTLKAHLNALQAAGAHPLRGACWHFTHVLFDTETQLRQATGITAVSSGLLNVLNSTCWTTGNYSTRPLTFRLKNTLEYFERENLCGQCNVVMATILPFLQ